MKENIQYVACRMKQSVSVPAAMVLFAVAAAAADSNVVWNPQWKQHQEIIVRETAGIGRTNEPIEVELKFSQPWRDAGITNAVKREQRVFHGKT